MFDYVIIGQGIAGSCLSYSLIQRNKKVMVLDDGYKSSSSIMAAGMFNPVSFRKVSLSWKSDEFVPFARKFYKALELELNESFLFEKEILRVFASVGEQNNWMSRTSGHPVARFISDRLEFKIEGIKTPYGAGRVTGAGYVDLNVFLQKYRSWLLNTERMVEVEVNPRGVLKTQNKWKVHTDLKDFTADNVIFCEGSRLSQNPFFNRLPLQPNKGEMLLIEAPGLQVEEVINRSAFILPIGDHQFLVGATFEREFSHVAPTESARNDLLERLDAVLEVPFSIKDQWVGVRPTVRDRKPLIGLHPQHKGLAVFNGMGTKGVMMAPYFANQFARFLEEGGELEPSVDVKRYLA